MQESTALLNERYQILAEIGAGGFGAVYKARDMREQDRLVAVKQINLKGLTSQEIIEATDAFNREAQILSDLSHPLLPRIFDRFSDPEHWYLVMNFIDGSTLDEYLQQQAVRSLPARSGLSLAETLAITLQLCDALHYLHSQQPPVIFRDLKPGNIMRTTSGRLYLIDFGIARRFKPGQAKDTIPFGSPGYAAPEQYGKAQTTPRADIYSLGALLFCLISGGDPSEHPFQFPPLRLYGIDGIRELDALIQRMVALDPTRRPADIQEVQVELQHIQRLHAQSNKQSHIWIPPQGQTPPPTLTTASDGQQQIFLTPSGTQPPARKSSRRRVLTIGLIAGGAALVGGVAAMASQAGRSTSSYPGRLTHSQIPSVLPKGLAYWSQDLGHVAAIDTNTNQIILYTDQGQQLQGTVPLPDGSNITIQWSPDNKQITIFGGNNGDVVWDIDNAQQVLTLPASLDSTLAVWSPDGQYIAVGYTNPDKLPAFALFNTTNGKRLFQQTFSEQAIPSLAWTSDSKYILRPVLSALDAQQNVAWTFEVWDSQAHKSVRVIIDRKFSDLDASVDTIPVIACSSSNQITFLYQNFIWLGNLKDTGSIHKFTNFTPDGFVDANDLSEGNLIWSPNEIFLAILFNGNLIVWEISSGRSFSPNGNNLQGNINAFAWAANSKSITVVDNNNIISRWSVG